MNTLTGWQKVVILAILIAAIPLTFAFVAPAAGAVTGIATTLVGSLFLNFKGAGEVPPEVSAAIAAALAALSPKAKAEDAKPTDTKESK